MKKKLEEEGVWRTIGGRRVFIRTGQSLKDAMKASGKFENKKKMDDDYSLYKRAKENPSSIDPMTENSTDWEALDKKYSARYEKESQKKPMTYEEYSKKIEEITSSPSYKEKMDKAVDELNEKYGYKNDWRKQIEKNNEKLEKDLKEYIDKYDPFGKNLMNDNIKDGYYELFRENERANAKIKIEKPNEEYMPVEAYAGYKEKFNNTWGRDGSINKVTSARMYTNDEFMEHLEDSNWHSERRQLLEAKLTNQELSYIKDRTNVSAWGVENLNGKDQVDSLIKEAKTKFGGNNLMSKYSGTVDYLKQTTNMSPAQILELLKRIDEDKK